jgi:protein phosphatase PTC7
MREAHVTSKALLSKPDAALPQSSHSLAMAILQRAWECTHAPGSSTALVAFIRPVERELTVANLGDSGVMVLRPDGPQYVVAFRTKEQQHAFNFPFQLSSLETHRQHPNTQHDKPSQADVSTFYLRPRDIVVAATDGVFDNVFEDDIAQMATQHCSSTKDSQACANALAKAIVRMAQDVGKSPTALAPFGLNALKSMRQLYKGGKLDDATTVVAVVSDAKPASKL